GRQTHARGARIDLGLARYDQVPLGVEGIDGEGARAIVEAPDLRAAAVQLARKVGPEGAQVERAGIAVASRAGEQEADGPCRAERRHPYVVAQVGDKGFFEQAFLKRQRMPARERLWVWRDRREGLGYKDCLEERTTILMMKRLRFLVFPLTCAVLLATGP